MDTKLEEIEARIWDCQTYNFGLRNGDTLAHYDAPYLLAQVRELSEKLEAVKELADSRGRCGWSISADEVRKAIK